MFSTSSQKVVLQQDGKIEALCRRTDGEWVPAMLDLNFYLENSDGTVQFAWHGNFLASSANVSLTGTTLSGSARRRDQSLVPFKLDLDYNVANIEGRLLWLVKPKEPYHSPDNDEGGLGSYDVSTDKEMLEYAESRESNSSRRVVNIKSATAKDKKDIQELVSLWDFDLMDRHLGQTTMVEFPRNYDKYTPYRGGWRIDNQENGSFPIGALQYYSLAVQNGSDVYASVLVPVRYRLGRTRIRNAFLVSMDNGAVVTIGLPPSNQTQPPAQDSAQAEAVFVQSLLWVLHVGAVKIRL